MTHPLGYYYYLRGDIDGLLPAPMPARGKPLRRKQSAKRRGSLRAIPVVSAVALPVVLTGVVALALRLLA